MQALVGIWALCCSVLLQISSSKDISLGRVFGRDIVSVGLSDLFGQVQKLEKFELSAEYPAAAAFGYSGGEQGSVDISGLGLSQSTCLDSIISPDQKMIAVVCDKKKLLIIDAVSGKQLFTYRPERFGSCHKPQIDDGYLYLFCTTSESKDRYTQFHEVYAVNLRTFVVTNTDMNLGDDQFMGWFQFDVQTTMIETSMLNTVNDTNPEQAFTYLVVWDGYNNVAASTWITSYNKNVRFIRVEGGKISNQSVLLKVDESDQHGLVYDVAVVNGLLNVVIHANFSRSTQPKGYMFALEVNESLAAVAKTNRSVAAEQFNITDGFFRYVRSIGQYVAWDFKRNEMFSCAPDATTFVKTCTPGAKVLQDSNNMIPRVKNCVKDTAAVGPDKDSVFLCSFEEKTTDCKSAPSSGVIRIRPSGVELLATIPNPSAIGYFFSPSYESVKILTLTQLQTSGLTPSTVTIDASKLPDTRPFRFAIRNSDKVTAVVIGDIVSSDSDKIEDLFTSRKVVASGWKHINLVGMQGSDFKIAPTNSSFSDPLISKMVIEGPQNNFTRMHRVGNYMVTEFYNQGRANIYQCSNLPLPNNGSRVLEKYCVYLHQITFDSSRWLAEVFSNQQNLLLFKIRGFNSEQYITFNTRTLGTCVQTITAVSPEQVLVNYVGGLFQIIHVLYEDKGLVKIYTMSTGSDCKIEQAALLELQGTGYLTKFTAGLSTQELQSSLLIYQQDLSTPSSLIANLGNLKLINDSIQSSGPVDRAIFDPAYSKYCFLGSSLVVSYTLNGKANVFMYGIGDGAGSRKEFPLKKYNLSDVTEIHCSEKYQRIVLVGSVKQGSAYSGKVFILSPGTPRIIREYEPATVGTNCTRGFSSLVPAFVYSCVQSTWSNTSAPTDPQLNLLWETSYSLTESLSVITALQSSATATSLDIPVVSSTGTQNLQLTLSPFVSTANTSVKSLNKPIQWTQTGENWCFVLEDVIGLSGHVFGVFPKSGVEPADVPQVTGRISKHSSLPEGVVDLVSTDQAGLFVAVKENGIVLAEFDQTLGLKLVAETEKLVPSGGPVLVAALGESAECNVVATDADTNFYYSRFVKSGEGKWSVDSSIQVPGVVSAKVLNIWLLRDDATKLHLLVKFMTGDFKVYALTANSIGLVGPASISSKDSSISTASVKGKHFMFSCDSIQGQLIQEEIISAKDIKRTVLQEIDKSLISGGCQVSAQSANENSDIHVALYLSNENHITIHKTTSAGTVQKLATLELPESSIISTMHISGQILGVSLQSSYLQLHLWCFYNLTTAITSTPTHPQPLSYCTSAAPSAFLSLSPSRIYLPSTGSLFTLSPTTTLCSPSKPANPLSNLTLNWNTSLVANTNPDAPDAPKKTDNPQTSVLLVYGGLLLSVVIALAVVVVYCRTRGDAAKDDAGDAVKASFEEQTLRDNEL